ncbi:hypothetical protein ADL32_16885 [Streptomyces albidoflavus]|nr:hypothetical protein ADL32_16885 [Streptomyces albidoflavus]
MQNPSVRPGRSPRDRPTGAPHSARLQNRLRSGTRGSDATAVRGSGRGTSGTATRPAPSRPRCEELFEAELRTDTDRVVARPDCDRDSCPDTDRREERDPVEAAVRADPEPRADPADPRAERPERAEPPAATPVGGEESDPSGDTTGAIPHSSQYNSPPPTSSYAPAHPGRWQLRLTPRPSRRHPHPAPAPRRPPAGT